MSVLKLSVISRRGELHRCWPSHGMSSGSVSNSCHFFTISLADAHIQPSGFHLPSPPITHFFVTVPRRSRKPAEEGRTRTCCTATLLTTLAARRTSPCSPRLNDCANADHVKLVDDCAHSRRRTSLTTTTSPRHTAAYSVSAAADATKPPTRTRFDPPILAPLRRWMRVQAGSP